MGLIKRIKKLLGIKKKYVPHITQEMRDRQQERQALNHEIKKRELALRVRKLELKEKEMDLEEAKLEDEILDYEQQEPEPLEALESDDPETEVLKTVLRGIAQNVQQSGKQSGKSPRNIDADIMVSKGNTEDFESFKREIEEAKKKQK